MCVRRHVITDCPQIVAITFLIVTVRDYVLVGVRDVRSFGTGQMETSLLNLSRNKTSATSDKRSEKNIRRRKGTSRICHMEPEDGLRTI